MNEFEFVKFFHYSFFPPKYGACIFPKMTRNELRKMRKLGLIK